MSTDAKERAQGEVILHNYKKQLAERMAREKVDRGQLIEEQMKKDPNASGQDIMMQRLQAYESTEVPDPEVLKAILNRKTKYDRDLRQN